MIEEECTKQLAEDEINPDFMVAKRREGAFKRRVSRRKDYAIAITDLTSQLALRKKEWSSECFVYMESIIRKLWGRTR
jgi:hypothetical protein